MSLPAWYETYLLLHQAKVYPFNEITSVPFMSDVWNVNSVFLTPTDWNSPPPALAPYSLLPSAFDTLSAGQAAAISQVASRTLEDVQAALEQPQNPEPPIPEFIPAISTQPACASNLPASLEASSPLKKSAASQQQQENSGPQTSGEEDDDIAKKTRRIASKLHIMASKKQLDPAKVSDEEARALIDLQLKTNAPLLPPWYRHAHR